MKNLLIVFVLLSCVPVKKDSQLQATKNPVACVINDAKTVFTKAAANIAPPK